jgi:hypothetical protein
VSNSQEFQTWLSRGAPLVQNHKEAKWALGCWLLEADVAQAASAHTGNWWPDQPDHIPYSAWVKAAAQHYGYTYDTFLQFKRVAAVFPTPATRVAALSWHHHQAVAAVDDAAVRAEWLALAARNRWAANELQQKVAIAKSGLSVAEALQLSQVAAALGMAPAQVQVLIVRQFLATNDDTKSNFVFKHRASFEPTDG